jgi:hypothetical protein
MCDLIKCAIIIGIVYYLYKQNETSKQVVIVRRDDGWDWRSPPYLQNRYLPTEN